MGVSRAAPLREALRARARNAGFDVVRFTTPHSIPLASQRLADFVGAGRHGDMEWMEANAGRRADPAVLWPQARSVIVLGLNYGPAADPLDVLQQPARGAISVYAQGRDYHDVVKGKLKQVAQWLHAKEGAEVKVFVDTAPVMEKPLAEAAGVGWQGKHTNLVSREFGSWLFLGSIFTTARFEPDEAHGDHCGDCTRCLDICPTKAFPAPYQLDARRCISYLTIEHKGHIAREFREPMGNRIFGCDDCLAICPWNKFASEAREARLAARPELDVPGLAGLLALDDAGFRARFAGTPVRRAGRDRFLRNVLIAAGNSGDASLAGPVIALIGDASPLVRAMAVWAARRLCPESRLLALRATHLDAEPDPSVRAEWDAAA
ncbi:MAG: tRNA epoxyqueuosine(34) reductase QueG [Pseudomonadota bacterium]|nr:tRNA epoxyqueuosine(34) reductase QueG [Pseudomonadota bacterium]